MSSSQITDRLISLRISSEKQHKYLEHISSICFFIGGGVPIHERLVGRRMKVFVAVFTYRAKPGEEDAIIALHEDWQRHQQSKAKEFLSGELLRNAEDVRAFVTLMRFANLIAAQAILKKPDHDKWYQRLERLTETGLTVTDCVVEWQSIPD